MSLLLCGGLPKAAHKNAVCIHINLGLWPKKSTVTRNQATLRFLLASDQSEAQFGQESSIRDHFQLFSHWLWLLVIRSSTGFLTPLFLSPEAATLDDIAVTLWETDQMHWNRFWISDPAKSPWGDCWSTIDFTWKKLFKLLVLNQPCFFARFFHWCLHLDLGKMSSAWAFNQELTDRLPSLGMLVTAVGPTSWFFF